ncbi:MAG: T9SS C-terminal target domain-containing protein [Bacteroidetes bacterium]|nr:MAG: T9SS C-terminal target domain-containing protein [Bacteroidota bacterium]REJ99970.1 MAG: T9SS C-terminal target domain-containing protein [Bacteroidota bacterium]REK50673.1 MAG: T9SS C-terminal target domain-containing protein [Bacteroidota bacterium]
MMKTNYSTNLMKALRQKFALIMVLFTFIGGQDLYASHAAGGDLTYTYLGNNQYRITFTFYRDCFGISAPTTKTVAIASASCGLTVPSVTLTRDPNVVEITAACSTAVTTCNGGNATGIQAYTYSGIVTLPALCPDWRFSVLECCRNAAITTLQGPAGYDLYNEAFVNNTTINNNSPTFSIPPIAFMCIGQENVFNHGAIDVDGDSLVYSFIPPRDAVNTPVTYLPGYSIASPISSSTPVTIDPVTGDIRLRPTATEVGVIAVLVLEYRNGVLIGSVMRDIQVYTTACSNTLPALSGINATNDFSISSCGGAICFDIFSNDADPGDTLTMTWNNGIPAATFTVTGSPIPTGHFCWTPQPSDARAQPYVFIVTIRDNACPSPGVRSYAFSIQVSSLSMTVTHSPSVSCFGSHNGTASVSAQGTGLQYTWTGPNGLELFTPSISHLRGGVYTVNVVDASGCVGQQTITIAEPAPVSVSVTGVNPGCNTTLGSATAVASGGTPGYTYTWSNSQTGPNLNNVASGTYNVSVRDSRNCLGTGSVTLTGGIPISVTMTSTPATCVANNGTATVNVTGGSGNIQYNWTPNVSTTSTATGLITGSYACEVVDLTTNCVVNVSTIVQNNAGISATITQQSDATCASSEDGSATVMATGGTPPYSYLWPNGDTTASVNNLAPGTYLAMVEDYLGCRAFASVTIGSMFPAPNVNLGPDTTICIGSTLLLNAGAGFSSYLWSDNSTNQSLLVSTPGTYSVLVTDANGCQNFDAIVVNFITCQRSRPAGTQVGTVTNHAFSVYPNPARDQVQVSIAQIKKTKVNIRVTDLLGNRLISSSENAEYSYNKNINISGLAAGIYIVRVEYGNEVQTVRIVKE